MQKNVSKEVINCAFEVSNHLGAGFLESVYENALCVELQHHGIAFERQKHIEVLYKGHQIGSYVADLIIENQLLVELKAISGFSGQHEAQLMNYLKATGVKVGLLLNFGTPKIGVRRIVWQYEETERI